ncbi:MAG: RNA polymerase sigma factor [Gammaproteobacteria bacterium]|nr:RNA polymerase sigma factor [Gammaproteobacteria bacterium]
MDEAAFREVHAQTARRLRAFLISALKDPPLADDLLQEAYIRLLRADLKDANIHQVRSYLYKTALSLVADHGRKLTRQRRLRENLPEPEPDRPRPDLSIDMQRLFDKLAPRQQALLWLAYVEGASHREIAGALEIRESGVRVALFRARGKMAQILEKHGWNAGETT